MLQLTNKMIRLNKTKPMTTSNTMNQDSHTILKTTIIMKIKISKIMINKTTIKIKIMITRIRIMIKIMIKTTTSRTMIRTMTNKIMIKTTTRIMISMRSKSIDKNKVKIFYLNIKF